MFGGVPRLFRAPGRVNLIGEHTDYNDGFVLPTAIDRECAVAATRREDTKIRVHALDVNESAEFDLQGAAVQQRGNWQDFVEGVARCLHDKSPLKTGADIVFTSSVPIGAGLSSSAAIEIAVGFALLKLNEDSINLIELALAAQRAEHEFVGAKIGIMDQFTSAMGKANHALLIDCRALTAAPIRLNFNNAAIVVVDSGVKHELATSEYNRRREECETAVEILAKEMPDIRALRDVSVAEFEKHQNLLPEIIKRRCRHVVTENARTAQAAELLKTGDAAAFGQLMFQSHESLRDDYAVSSIELDFLVETAKQIEGIFGARMTGGGFGGCTVNLIENNSIEEFEVVVRREYQKQFQIEPKIYPVKPSDGASEL